MAAPAGPAASAADVAGCRPDNDESCSVVTESTGAGRRLTPCGPEGLLGWLLAASTGAVGCLLAGLCRT